jgi:hypothetical protein
MNNESNDFLNSISKGNNSSNINSLDSSSLSNSDGDILSMFKNISITTWVVIFFILAFFGFNIFVYLAKGTQDITNFFRPYIEYILYFFAYITSSVVDVTAAGTQNIINKGTQVANKNLTEIQIQAQKIEDKTSPTILKSEPVQQTQTNKQGTDIMSNNTLNNTLNTANVSNVNNNNNNNEYQADESTSKIQSGGNKSGWCYIGEDRGFRSCVEVGQQDSCMSGDIFPSQDICINPSLRA